ncbi:MAG: DUF192 domain-containing protein [Coriobacteriia bacterium]|nr:DUF192 domain-containing protein [Coriobacteriia bacterium]
MRYHDIERHRPAPRSASRPHRGLSIAAFVALFAAAAALAYPAVQIATSPAARVRVGDVEVGVTVADTPLRQAWGLQGRSSLAEGAGMLFPFDPPATGAFVRRGVPFALDVVFVGADGRVSGIGRLDAGSERAAPPVPARWALEVPGGWAARAGVTTGTAFRVLRPAP